MMASKVWLAVAAILGAGTPILADGTVCTPFMCIRAVVDSASGDVVYSLNSTASQPIPQSSFGWMAIGFGSAMINTPMILVWPNTDTTFTLSQRSALSYSEPRPVVSPPFQASLVPAQSFTNSSDTLISFSVPMSAVKLQSGRQSLVWAFGAVNPNSANPAAQILQHRASGTTILDVLPDEPTASVSQTVSQTTGISKAAEPTLGPDVPKNDSVIVPQGRTSYQTMVIAHAVLGALFAMFLLPMGVLIARFGKSTTPIKPGEVSVHRWWFPAHAVWQGIIALAIGVAAVAVGYNLKKKRGGGDIDSTHRRTGLAVLILLIAQVTLGILTHWRRQILRMRSTGRSWINFVHIILGAGLIGLAWAQVWTGMQNEWPIWSGYPPAGAGWRAGWGVGVAIPIVLYIAGCVFLLPRQRRAEHAADLPLPSGQLPTAATREKAAGAAQHRER